MPSQAGRRVYPLIASALTHIHPGAGRSPGVVDLPVIRDSLGYPYIPGSEVKGALKTMVAVKNSCLDGNGRIQCPTGQGEEGSQDKEKKRKCKMICCLLGGEPGEEGASSKLSIIDLYPLLLPVPSLDMGVVYATSPLLLSRVLNLLDARGEGGGGGKAGDPLAAFRSVLKTVAEECRPDNGVARLVVFEESGEEPKGGSEGGSGQAQGVHAGEQELTMYILASSVKVRQCIVGKDRVGGQDAINKFKAVVEGLNNAYKALRLNGRILVVPENLMQLIIEKSLVRLTRVRLQRHTKTVAHGALWTEEYIPHTTLFAGSIVDTGFRGEHCKGSDADQKSLKELLGEVGLGEELYLVVGGKETVGKGLLKAVILGLDSGGGEGAGGR